MSKGGGGRVGRLRWFSQCVEYVRREGEGEGEGERGRRERGERERDHSALSFSAFFL